MVRKRQRQVLQRRQRTMAFMPMKMGGNSIRFTIMSSSVVVRSTLPPAGRPGPAPPCGSLQLGHFILNL